MNSGATTGAAGLASLLTVACPTSAPTPKRVPRPILRLPSAHRHQKGARRSRARTCSVTKRGLPAAGAEVGVVTTRQTPAVAWPPKRVLLAQGLRKPAATVASVSRGTTSGDRTERGRLLHRLGGPRVDVPRRGRQVDGATAPAGAGAAAAACEVLAQARSPAPRASGRPGRRVIEATVSRKVRRGCSRSQPARRTDPRGGCSARKLTVIWGP
jgi:hypothetical protein